MPTAKLSINVQVAITQNVVYTLPARACKITTGLTLEQSNDGTTWAVNADQVYAGQFIRAISGSGNVKCIPC